MYGARHLDQPPLPEAEGADWGGAKYADLIFVLGIHNLQSFRQTPRSIDQIHNRLGFSGRWMTSDTSVGPLSLWERAEVRVQADASDLSHCTIPNPAARPLAKHPVSK
jgi:hypothetical protein